MEQDNTYSRALGMVRHARTGKLLDRKKLGNNTWATLDDDGIVSVVLHSTAVVSFSPDGVVTLNSGGWRTVTTKERMNRYAPGVRVSSNRGVWHLGLGSGDVSCPFYDGIQYHGDTMELMSDPLAVLEQQGRDEKRKEVRKAVKGWVARLMADPDARNDLADKLEGQDFGGDCLYCRRVSRDDGTHAALGDELGGHDHLELHLEEDYFVPLLFVNAAIEKYGERAGVNAALLATPVELRRGERLSLQKALVGYFEQRLAPRTNARDKGERDASVARGWV